MEESISEVGRSLAALCYHLESSSTALKHSVDRRPIPLDSASSTFVQCLNRRVSTASGELELLETMASGTVSFEELLGHCNEVYKKNDTDLQELEDHLISFGYVPEPEAELEEEVLNHSLIPVVSKLKTFDADDMLEDLPSLKDLGLSDTCLATIASQADNYVGGPDVYLQKPTKDYGIEGEHESASKIQKVIEGNQDEVEEDAKSDGASQYLINLSSNDYENLPSYMKTLASWEDLLTAAEKLNSVLIQKQKTGMGNFFHQEELASMDLGRKARSYLLLLVRMNHLVVQTISGLISYRVL